MLARTLPKVTALRKELHAKARQIHRGEKEARHMVRVVRAEKKETATPLAATPLKKQAASTAKSTAEIHREMHRDRKQATATPSAEELEMSEMSEIASRATKGAEVVTTYPKAHQAPAKADKGSGKGSGKGSKANPSGHADAVALPSLGKGGGSHVTRRGLTKLEELSSSDSRRDLSEMSEEQLQALSEGKRVQQQQAQ